MHSQSRVSRMFPRSVTISLSLQLDSCPQRPLFAAHPSGKVNVNLPNAAAAATANATQPTNHATARSPANSRPPPPPLPPEGAKTAVRPSIRPSAPPAPQCLFFHPSLRPSTASLLPSLPTLPTYIQSDPSPTLSIQVLPPLPVIEQCGINRNVTPREKKQWNKKKRRRGSEKTIRTW